MENFEKLGSFYLGKKYDIGQKKILDDLLLYDSKDLTTHAVSLGMTGSGKTGLCISLLEEAAIDSIPAIIIDPKGDMTNLLLTFPDLLAEDFRPWIDEREAAKHNLSAEDFSQKQASMWKNGLESWGETPERIKLLKESADFSIYTPGSTAGLSVNILKSFTAPSDKVKNDPDTFQERISSTVTSLLGLLGIDADPVQSREYILLSNILNHFWIEDRDLSLADIIQSLQEPPFHKIGVFDINSFYPAKERLGLAMKLNNLIASPAFKAWMQGDALDIKNLLYTENGKPRITIFYIAHLSDAERMFFMSLLLNQFISWMRTQTGTGSLRALLYIDELFGYMPPLANPPTKKPLLTLLKQARAYGVGVVMATQNPVDLDYKGLSNTGTWLIGRLQTDRDRDRVLDGLAGASIAGSGKFDRKAMSELLSGLDKRCFLMHNVHEDNPVVFHSRWAMSYLCGPMTRNQIKQLVKKNETDQIKQATIVSSTQQTKPSLAGGITQLFLPVRGAQPAASSLIYKPFLGGFASVLFSDRKLNIEESSHAFFITPINDGVIVVNWETAELMDIDESELESQYEHNAIFDRLPSAAGQSKNYTKWKKDFHDYLYRFQKKALFKSPLMNEISLPGESEGDFRIRIKDKAHEKRDSWIKELKIKYAKKMSTVEEKIRKSQQKVEREKAQAKQQKYNTVLSIGATLLGAFLGRKAVSMSTVSKTRTAISSAGRSIKESGDVARAEEDMHYLQQQLKDLDSSFQQEIDASSAKYDVMNDKLESVIIRPRKSDISIKLMVLSWLPYWRHNNGELQKAF